MSSDTNLLQDFIAFSAKVTDFTAFSLYGTGLAESYFDTLANVVGEEARKELLQAFRRIQAGAKQAAPDPADLELRLRSEIFSDAKLGPIARNVIKLWYVGIWYQLPQDWRETFGARENDTTFVVSPAAYTEGLLWKAIDANPSGAKGPGYGTWQEPPRLTDAVDPK